MPSPHFQVSPVPQFEKGASPLFRAEALAARRDEWLGTIQLAAPPSAWAFSAIALAMAIALLALLIFGHYTRRETVNGQLLPAQGLLSVGSPSAGIVTRVLVSEGQPVKRGDALLEISGELSSSSLGSTRALVSTQLEAQRARWAADLNDQQRMADEQERSLRVRQTSLRDQIAQIDAQLELQRKQTESAQQLLDRIEPLRDKGYISAVQIQQEESDVLAGRTQLKALQRQRLDVQQQIDDARQEIAQIPLTLAGKQNDIHRSIAQIDQQLAQNEVQRSVLLRAPADATVSTLPVDPGQTVAAGQTLLTLVPKGSELQAQLLIPSSGIGFIRLGDRVVLRYRAYPYQKFGLYYGRVAQISSSAFTPAEIATISGQQTTEPLYRVAVKLDATAVLAYGKKEPLRPGMTLDADILQERRRLIEWVFEPLYGFGHRVVSRGDTP